MEFILGVAVTVACGFLGKYFYVPYAKNMPIKVSYRQSDVFEAIRPALPLLRYIQERPETQASKYANRHLVKMLFIENEAYWIKDNSVFVADVINGNVDKEGARVVDTIDRKSVV